MLFPVDAEFTEARHTFKTINIRDNVRDNAIMDHKLNILVSEMTKVVIEEVDIDGGGSCDKSQSISIGSGNDNRVLEEPDIAGLKPQEV